MKGCLSSLRVYLVNIHLSGNTNRMVKSSTTTWGALARQSGGGGMARQQPAEELEGELDWSTSGHEGSLVG